MNDVISCKEIVLKEIIYCKDCKWKQGSECVSFADVLVFPYDYCSRAERRIIDDKKGSKSSYHTTRRV